MGKTYIVREGKVRGEGRYLTGNTSQSVADWGAVGDAWEYLGRLTASADADRHGGRVVRVVSLRERLRKAKKRIAEMAATPGYYSGRADERKVVVEHIRNVCEALQENGDRTMVTTMMLETLTALRGELERGEHVKGGG